MIGARRRAGAGVAWLVIIAALILSAGCGGDDVPGAVKLAGTRIPPATVPPTPTPICDPPTVVTVPTSFPPEISLPRFFVPWIVETTPHLRVLGRLEDARRDSLAFHLLLEPALVDQLRLQFQIGEEVGPNGGFVLTAPGGRTGEFVMYPIAECPGQVELLYDIYWITN